MSINESVNERQFAYDDILMKGDDYMGVELGGQEFIVTEEDFMQGTTMIGGVPAPAAAYKIVKYDVDERIAFGVEVTDPKLLADIGRKMRMDDIDESQLYTLDSELARLNGTRGLLGGN